jgi:A/G-specific adenine glycosylase
VVRILSRIFAVPQSVDRPATLEKLWNLAASLLPRKNPGDLNQALMELGATVCFPLTPQCVRCPVNKLCAAHWKEKELFYPVRSQKNRYEKIRMTALVLRNSRNEVWLEKQPDRGRWGGLWMFPFWNAQREMAAEIQEMDLNPVFFLKVSHAFTKYRITLDVYGANCEKSVTLKQRNGKWIAAAKLGRTALPSPHKKIAQALAARAIF